MEFAPGDWLLSILGIRTNPPFNLKMEELFLVLPTKDAEGYEIVEIPPKPEFRFKGGKLLVFHSKKFTIPTVLNTRKFNYPNISVPKTPKSL